MKRHFFVKKDKIMEVINWVGFGFGYCIRTNLGNKIYCINTGKERIDVINKSLVFGEEKVLVFFRHPEEGKYEVVSLNLRNIKSITIEDEENDNIYYFI